jgi:hypothetical protein
MSIWPDSGGGSVAFWRNRFKRSSVVIAACSLCGIIQPLVPIARVKV